MAGLLRKVKNDDAIMYGLFLSKKAGLMVSLAWSRKKGDWWYHENPDDAKFFDWRQELGDTGIRRSGIYIGRLALAILKDTKKG